MADLHGCTAHSVPQGGPSACRCGKPPDPGDGTLPPTAALTPQPSSSQPPVIVRGPAGQPPPPPPPGFRYPPGGVLFVPLEVALPELGPDIIDRARFYASHPKAQADTRAEIRQAQRVVG